MWRFCVSEYYLEKWSEKREGMFYCRSEAVPVFNTAISSPGVSHGGLKVKALVQLVTAENFWGACF